MAGPRVTDPATPAVNERRPRGRRSFAFDIAVALAATAVEVTAAAEAGPGAVVLAAVAGGVLVLRRSAPLAVLATTLAATAGVVALGGEPTGLTAGIGLYTTAALCERRVSLAALVPIAASAAGLSAATVNAPGRQTSAPLGAAIAVMLTIGIWALGAYVQTRRRYTDALAQRTAQAEREREQLARIALHEERASIARELHDIVAHSVTVMLIGVRGARDVLHTAPDVADDTLARVETSGEQSLVELRRILALLRSPADGAEPRPQPSLADLEGLIAGYRAAGLPVRLEVTGPPRPLPGGVELSVYRIVEEALTNALKHAQPAHVTVTLSYRGSRIELEVVDDGAGQTDDADAPIGHGLVGMRERVALLGGELETGRRDCGGYRVAARLPVRG
jgi:signal transduction histidine kinase